MTNGFNREMLKIFHVFLIFSLIFNYRVPLFYSSVVLTFFLCLPFFLSNRNAPDMFFKAFSNKYLFKIIYFSFLLIILSLVNSIIIHESYEFSFVKNIIVQLVAIVTTTLVLIVTFKQRKNERLYLEKIIFISFILQSFIMLGSLSNEYFFNFIQIFQPSSDKIDSVIELFKGARGGALSGNLFFGLGVTYGLVVIFYVKGMIDERNILIRDVFILLIFFIGITMSARVGYLGFILSFMYYFYYSIMKRRVLQKGIVVVGVSVSIGVGVYFLFPDSIMVPINNMLHWGLEPVYNYFNGEGFVSQSTSALTERMLIYPTTLEGWLLGEGRYIGLDGKYYKHTDSGYSRYIFYGGLILVFIMAYYQILFLRQKIKNNKFFLTIIFSYFLLLNIKGDVLGYLPSALVILILFNPSITKGVK